MNDPDGWDEDDKDTEAPMIGCMMVVAVLLIGAVLLLLWVL